MRLIVGLIGLLILMWAGCTPLLVTGVTLTQDNCDCTCVSWTTNIPAQCALIYCKDGQCTHLGRETEYKTQHGDGAPRDAQHITIVAFSKDGQEVTQEVR